MSDGSYSLDSHTGRSPYDVEKNLEVLFKVVEQ